jgi:hypothetical protein
MKNKEQLIELVKYAASEILAPTNLSTKDAESIVDDFIDIEQLTIPHLSNKRELLIDFAKSFRYMGEGFLKEQIDDVVNAYLTPK